MAGDVARELSRRRFLALLAATAAAGTGAAACSSDDDDGGDSGDGSAPGPTGSGAGVQPAASPSAQGIDQDPFTLGVASGDPLPESVILWTRLAPDPLSGGGLGDADFEVAWDVANDEAFEDLVASGTAPAPATLGQSVHVDATGLQPDTWYHYRFRIGDHESPAGRTRTAPAVGTSPESLTFAFASCQQWQDGLWAAYRHMADEDLDMVLFLGDYIYEGGVVEGSLRLHNGPECTTLADYRNRYALYKGDPLLQAAHARFPWVLMWDDHEVENNYAGLASEDGVPPEEFAVRRLAAYQAYYEHLPLRVEPPSDTGLEVYRGLSWGTLADLFVLDTRQGRADQPCTLFEAIDVGLACDTTGPDQVMLSVEQEAWLIDGLSSSPAAWKVIAQAVVFSSCPIRGTDLTVEDLGSLTSVVLALGPLESLVAFNYDQWDGYAGQRQRILDAVTAAGGDTIVLTGDIHSSGAVALRSVADDPTSAVVGAEFVTTSISSLSPAGDVGHIQGLAFGANFDYFNSTKRGYVRCDVTADEWRTTYRTIADARDESSDITDDAAFVVTPGGPGLEPA